MFLISVMELEELGPSSRRTVMRTTFPLKNHERRRIDHRIDREYSIEFTLPTI